MGRTKQPPASEPAATAPPRRGIRARLSELPPTRDAVSQSEASAVAAAIQRHGPDAVYEACFSWHQDQGAALRALGIETDDRDVVFLVQRDAHAAIVDAVEMLEKHRLALEQRRDKAAVRRAIGTCRRMGWDWPRWLCKFVRETIEHVTEIDPDEIDPIDDLGRALLGRTTSLKVYNRGRDAAVHAAYLELKDLKHRGLLAKRLDLYKTLADWLAEESGGGVAVDVSTIKSWAKAGEELGPESAAIFTIDGVSSIVSLIHFLAQKGLLQRAER